MNFKLLLFVAFALLKKNKFSFLLMMLAVVVGTGVQIANIANLEGYGRELFEKGVVRATGHILVRPTSDGLIEHATKKARQIEKDSAIRAVSQRLVHAGVMLAKGRPIPARVIGLDPLHEETATHFCGRLISGRCLSRDETDGVVLGSRLAELSKVEVGERVKLIIPYQDLGEVKQSSNIYSVVGVVEGGGGFQGDEDVFISSKLLAAILGQNDSASFFLVFVDGRPDLAKAAAAIESQTQGVIATPWWKANGLVNQIVKGNRKITAISIAMVAIAVLLPILALLYISAVQQKKQIAVLGALGIGRLSIFGIYAFKSVIVGLLGIGPGIALGLALCCYFSTYPVFSYSGFEVRPALTTWAICAPSVSVLAAVALAGLVPAMIAAQTNAANSLKET